MCFTTRRKVLYIFQKFSKKLEKHESVYQNIYAFLWEDKLGSNHEI